MVIYTQFYKYKTENRFTTYTKSSLNYKKHMNENESFISDLKFKTKVIF